MKTRLVAAMLIGMLSGGALVNALLGQQVDRLTLANNELQEKLAATEKELQQVKENLAGHHPQTITALEVNVTLVQEKEIPGLDQARARLVIENHVREWLHPLLGQEVSRLDHLLIPRVIDQRQVEVDGRQYVLEVKLVVVAERTIIYLEALPHKNTPVPGMSPQ